MSKTGIFKAIEPLTAGEETWIKRRQADTRRTVLEKTFGAAGVGINRKENPNYGEYFESDSPHTDRGHQQRGCP
jgi:hypothetical protein